MPSLIDANQPPQGYATTAAVRANFAAAKSEIEQLQAAAAAPKTTIRAEAAPPAAVTLDATGADLLKFTATTNTTIDLTGGIEGQSLQLRITQDATGGRTINFGASVRMGADLPTWAASTGAGKTDYVAFRFNSTAAVFDLIAFNRGF